MGRGSGSDVRSGQVKIRQEAAGLNFIDVYHQTVCPQPLPFRRVFAARVSLNRRIGRHQREEEGDRVAYAGQSAAMPRSG